MQHRFNAPRLLAYALIATGALGGCTSLQSSDNFLGVITPYRVEIVQGNVVTKEQLALLKPGMSRLQVRDVLGSPLLTDIFHADRWDYVFTIKRQGTEPQKRTVTVWFDGERMKSVDAPELPTEEEFVAAITPPANKSGKPPPPLQLTEEQRKGLPAPPQAETTPSLPPTGATRTYPPLEKS